MRRTSRILLLVAALGVLGACPAFGPGTIASAADDPAELKLVPVDPQTIAAREKSLAESGPDGARLVAYLDCGAQRRSTTSDEVTIEWVRGKPYKFPSEAAGVLPTQPTIFFDEAEVGFKISGVDRTGRYLLGLTWWDYDDSGRTQSVLVGSPDGQFVRLAVTAIRLPNYTSDEQPPAERRFRLPSTFAQDGQVELTVRLVTGANAVVSELWIWQLDH